MYQVITVEPFAILGVFDKKDAYRWDLLSIQVEEVEEGVSHE